jgi:predicted O-methyltransferase YrrM
MSGHPRVALWDKILPDQPVNNDHYADAAGAYHRLLFEEIVRTSGIRMPTEDFRLELSDKVPYEAMASNPVGLRFLELLVAMTRARRVLEIGAFIGLSAMSMARALPEGGEVVTIEKFDHFAAIARNNFRNNGLADRITLLEGDAFAVIDRLPKDKPFDMVFIDGNKERYAHYFRALEPLLRPGGLAVIDDSLFHGDVLNARPRSEKGEGVKAFLDLAASCKDWRRLLVPIGNGTMLMIKPGG